MRERKHVRIGLIGAGFLAETRARCYGKTFGYNAEIVAVAARSEASARSFAARHGIANVHSDYRDLLASDAVDAVDLCIPNHLHRSVAEAAAGAGKHILCTKPLTAYVGQDLPADASDAAVAGRDRATMLGVAAADAEAMMAAADRAGVHLMYGENWIYAPAVGRADELIARTGGAILEMRGGECHSGSHSPFSKAWRHAGGGALIRLGAHPIGAMLYLKSREGQGRGGQPIRPVAVTAEVGHPAALAAATEGGTAWIAAGWQDVETWAGVIITFADGSRGIVHASDAVLGGMESKLDVFLSNAHFKCNLSPHNMLQAYTPDAAVLGDAYIMEKVSTPAGWTTPIPDEDWSSGHQAMCQDFVEVIAERRAPRSDGRLGLEVTRVIYAAYLAAMSGRRVALDEASPAA